MSVRACVARTGLGVRAPVRHTRLLFPPSQLRLYATDGKPEAGSPSLSKEQEELLRLLRESERHNRVNNNTQALGLAGSALSQGSYVRASKIDRWTGQGKKWRDLNGSEKVARSAVNTSRFFVISFGALLTAVIAYALSTELFAPNSPTVIYSEACKLIQKSDKVHNYLLEPYRFQTSLTERGADFSPLNPPSHPHRPSQTVHSYRFVDPRTGEDKMVMHFYVEAQDKDKPLSYWQQARASIVSGAHWLKAKTWEGYEMVVEWLHEEPAPADIAPPAVPAPVAPAAPSWWLTRKLRGVARGMNEVIGTTSDAVGMSSLSFATVRTEPGTWTEGEVHVELVKDERGTYQYKHFYVDIPNSRSPQRRRVHLTAQNGDVPLR